MQRNKSPKKRRKFRLLLDAAFPSPLQMPKLILKAHVEHVVYTLNLSRQVDDKYIYQKATERNCCVVTIDKGFKFQLKNKGSGIILVPADLSTRQLENSLLWFIKGNNMDNCMGIITRIQRDDFL